MLGHVILEYMQVYVLYMLKNNMKTTLFRDLMKGLMIIPTSETLINEGGDYNSYIMICLSLPIVLVMVSGVIGLLFKKLSADKRSIPVNIIYETFTFNSFVNISSIFIFNLLFNSLQFISILKEPTLTLSPSVMAVGPVLVYFNLVSALFILYLFLFVMNPKIGQNDRSWHKYLQSESLQ